jgi:hypothetical protein
MVRGHMILLLERPTANLQQLITDLQTATGWRVRHVCSPPDTIRELCSTNDVKVVILTVDQTLEPVIRLIRQARFAAESRGYDQLGILVLSWIPQAASSLSLLEDLNVEYLLRRDTDQIVEKIRMAQWRMRIRRGMPTLIVRRRDGHAVAILAKGATALEELRVGPRIRSLAEYLVMNSRTSHSTESLADALGICRQSVKEYLFRLREAFDRVRVRMGIFTPGRKTFWTEKRPGGYVHGIRANIRFDDRDITDVDQGS